MREHIRVAGLAVLFLASALPACRGEDRDPSTIEPTSMMLTAEDAEDDKRKARKP